MTDEQIDNFAMQHGLYDIQDGGRIDRGSLRYFVREMIQKAAASVSPPDGAMPDPHERELARAATSPVPIKDPELAAFHRFCDCCEDFDAGGHDVPKEMMSQLVRIGLIRPAGPGRHETTKFGDWLRDAAQPAEGSALVARPSQDESDNAPWLTLAHMICADAGIQPGHITDRLKTLRDLLEAALRAAPERSDTPAPLLYLDQFAIDELAQGVFKETVGSIYTEPGEGRTAVARIDGDKQGTQGDA